MNENTKDGDVIKGKGPRDKKCRQPIETGKSKETHLPPEPPEGMQPC